MSPSRSWQFIGGVDSVCYRFYDYLRRQVNARLVTFLSGHLVTLSTSAGAKTPAGGLRVLEAGSGPGFASSLFARRSEVATSVCMDLDPAALAEARKRDPSLPAVVGDLMHMPFADGAFALVFNSSTVEHLDDSVGAVREMQRVCADQGRVFVGVPYVWGPLGFQPLVRNTSAGVWLGRVFRRSSLDRLLTTAGLTPIAHLRYFWNFFIGVVATKQVAHLGPGPGGGL